MLNEPVLPKEIPLDHQYRMMKALKTVTIECFCLLLSIVLKRKIHVSFVIT